MWSIETDEGSDWWQVAATLAGPGQWAPLYRGLLDEALRRGVGEVDSMLPDIHDANTGVAAAGLHPDSNDERLYVFELQLEGATAAAPSA
jgi:hypothetical protein